jgi:hypothetical protein
MSLQSEIVAFMKLNANWVIRAIHAVHRMRDPPPSAGSELEARLPSAELT